MKISKLEKLVRKLLSFARKFLKDGQYYSVTSLLKKLRSKKRNIMTNIDFSQDVSSTAPLSKLDVVLTFDIDSIQCFNKMSSVVEYVLANNFAITINLLTRSNYKIKDVPFASFNANKIEFGLHGDYHDLYFMFRSKRTINKRIEFMIEQFPKYMKPKVYRHPGYGMNKKLALILSEKGFSHDASIKSGRYLSSPDSLRKPEYLYGTKLKEIYTHLGDDAVLREDELEIHEFNNLIKVIAKECSKMNVPMVVNFHPSIICRNMEYLDSLISFLKLNFEINSKKMSEI